MEHELDQYDKIYEILLNLNEIELAWDIIKAKNKKMELYLTMSSDGHSHRHSEDNRRND